MTTKKQLKKAKELLLKEEKEYAEFLDRLKIFLNKEGREIVIDNAVRFPKNI